ncbi:MAG TPA: hypothetical protein VFZ78_04260 [Flavisolibacter sp.]
MDEYNTGWDPEIRRYFRKILNSFSVGAFWLLALATAGIFFELGIVNAGLQWYNVVFYVVALASLAAVLLYFYRVWK